MVHACGATSSPCTTGWRHWRGRRRWLERHVCEILYWAASSSIIDLSTTYRAWRGLRLALQDPKVYIFALFSFTDNLGLGFINFFPTWVTICWVVLLGSSGSFLQSDRNNGFLNYYHTLTWIVRRPTLIFASLYLNWNSRVPWFLAAILCATNARHAGKPRTCWNLLCDFFIWWSDVTGERFWHITMWLWVVVVGYIIAQVTMSVGGRYVSLFLLASGYVGSSMVLVWVSSSVPRPPSKRAAGIGIVNGFGNLGNL